MHLSDWVLGVLADPVTKLPAQASDFSIHNQIIDARIYLKNTPGFDKWSHGQSEYEKLFFERHATLENYLFEIQYDQPVYDHFNLRGSILDVGGGAGTLRHFLPENDRYVCCDPWIDVLHSNSSDRRKAYPCLDEPFDFIAANAEFLPFKTSVFDIVHMRSMLDHVQVADLAILEARRVLKPDGRLLIGLSVEGGKTGRDSYLEKAKDLVKSVLPLIGINRWTDHHIFHPTYESLVRLLSDNGFNLLDTYWQPQWKDKVCYVLASKF